MNIACTEILNVTPVDATPRTRNVDDMELSQPTDPGPIQTTKPSMSTDRSLQSIDPAELHAQLVSKTEKSILEKLTQLEAEFLASIGQHSLHHRYSSSNRKHLCVFFGKVQAVVFRHFFRIICFSCKTNFFYKCCSRICCNSHRAMVFYLHVT